MGKCKIIDIKETKSLIKDGMTIMVGGFMTNGTPEGIIDVIVDSGAKDLTIICNDAGFPEKGVGKLLHNKQIKTLVASHVGLNAEVAVQSNCGELNLELIPQGTLAERIRSGGAGLGGFLTPTGLGTIVAEGKKVIQVGDNEYLLEEPLKADVALIKGYIVDEVGNIRYRGSTRNFNPIMATAAEIVIVEAEKIVPAGKIGPENVETPGLYIDYIVGGNN
jgi:acetate CoA/acetoacetate CoA-transferase alpha subunit